jgi:KilA-N domain
MLKNFGEESILYNWLRNRNTIEFLGVWEQLYNPRFKPLEFDRFNSQAGLNSFALSPKKWSFQRTLAKVNDKIHTDAIKDKRDSHASHAPTSERHLRN